VFSLCEFLAKKQIPTLKHAPYSSDLALCDFFFSQNRKVHSEEPPFQSIEDMHNKMAELLKALSQNDFRGCYKASNAHMGKCVASSRNCVTGIMCRYNNLISKILF
jgi:hypothetical protein